MIMLRYGWRADVDRRMTGRRRQADDGQTSTDGWRADVDRRMAGRRRQTDGGQTPTDGLRADADRSKCD